MPKRGLKKWFLARLGDDQHSLWSDANACLSDCDSDNVIDIRRLCMSPETLGNTRGASFREKRLGSNSFGINYCGFGKATPTGDCWPVATRQKLSTGKLAEIDTA